MASTAPNPVRLIGNPEENFFILGKKHYAQFRELQRALDPAQAQLVNRLKSLGQRWRSKRSDRSGQTPWQEWLGSYCEGLEIPPHEYLAFLDQLERAQLFGGVLPAHTSVFLWHPDAQRPEHLRLLDWQLPLSAGPVELILFQAPGQQSLLMMCLPGLAFWPMTLMNESGVTLALHSKYHSLDHPEGMPIGQIAVESMLESRSILELKKNLKRYQTKRLWGILACDPAGQVLAMDVMGPQMDGQTYQLSEEKLLVFNNAPLVKDQAQQSVAEPPTYAEFCRERRRWATEKLSGKVEGSALWQLTRALKASKFRAPAVTISTVQSLSLHPTLRRLEMLLGTPPMWAQGEMCAWSDLFVSAMRTPEITTQTFSKEEQLEWQARKEFCEAQRAMDSGDVALAFHRIQMGLVKATGELKQEASWVWAWWQWRHLEGKRDRLHLPTYVRQLMSSTKSVVPQLKFLMFLLELELDLAATISPPDLPSPFREWADHYLQAPLVVRLQMMKTPMARLDIMDCAPLSIPTWTKDPATG